MARSRNIKPGFFANEHLAVLPFETRLLFIGLWTLADRDGRLEDRPIKIKMHVFPADNVDVDRCLSELADAGETFIQRYVVDSVGVIQIVNWDKHQKPHHQEAGSILAANDFAPRREHTSHQGANTGLRKSGIRNQVKGISNQESSKRESSKRESGIGALKRTTTTPEKVYEYLLASNAAKKPKSLSDARRKKLLARLKVPDWPWREAIDKLPIPNTNSFTFQPDLDWLIANDENARKVAEGRYDAPTHSARTRNNLTAVETFANGQ